MTSRAKLIVSFSGLLRTVTSGGGAAGAMTAATLGFGRDEAANLSVWGVDGEASVLLPVDERRAVRSDGIVALAAGCDWGGWGLGGLEGESQLARSESFYLHSKL